MARSLPRLLRQQGLVHPVPVGQTSATSPLRVGSRVFEVRCFGTDTFVSTMVATIRRARNPYFRVHDSGDLFSPAYTWAWVRIVQALPDIRFWFPTRSWRPITMTRMSPAGRMAWELALTALNAEPNVTVRPSALFFNAPAPRIPGLAAGSTAADDGSYTCPASKQDNGMPRPAARAGTNPPYYLHLMRGSQARRVPLLRVEAQGSPV